MAQGDSESSGRHFEVRGVGAFTVCALKAA
jgi:hypothetical protein